jgi:hypothetical protein
VNRVNERGIVSLEHVGGGITDSDDPSHLPNHDLVIDPLLPLRIVQTRNDGQVAEKTNVLALPVGKDLGHSRSPLVNPRFDTALEPGGGRKHHSPRSAPFLRQPLDHVRREELRRFDRVTGAEQFRFRVFVGGGILVFSVRMGLFGGWGPLRWGRVGVLRFVAFLFVEEFIEEPMHGGGTTGIAGGCIPLRKATPDQYTSHSPSPTSIPIG